MTDDIPFALKAEDAPSPRAETVNPRRVRTQLAALDAQTLGLQDDAEALFAHVGDPVGRRTLRVLLQGLQEAHERIAAITQSVERGA
jgi:hypothetical protein